jgi:hypothetical protein
MSFSVFPVHEEYVLQRRYYIRVIWKIVRFNNHKLIRPKSSEILFKKYGICIPQIKVFGDMERLFERPRC